MIGETISHYRVVELLGSGGMGEVYLAEDTKLDRKIALKVLPTLVAGDPERRGRFEREAKAVAALNHPNIVTIYSVEDAGDRPFLTMELVDGQTLSELIPKPGLPIDQLLKLAIPLADAVSAAHERGITHRDLKPANIMVTREGRVKVLDFGLARLREELSQHNDLSLPTREQTGEGRVLGTVAYMSPEQAGGRTIDHRSDIFSLGVVLFEMATGERPFKGDTNVSVISSIIKDPPGSITEVRPDLPRDLGRIVRRALTKDPEHRYQTAKDLRNDLEALKEELDSGEVQPSGVGRARQPAINRVRARWWAAGVAGVLVVGAIAFGVYRSRGQTTPITASRQFESIKLARLTNTGKAGLAAISPDGRYVVHVVADGQQSLYMRQVATTSNVQIVPPAEVNYDGVAFPPDGNYVYYSAYATGEALARLYRVPVLGGTPQRLLDDVDTPVGFSPDGRQLAFIRGYQAEGESVVLVAHADGSGERRLATSKRPDDFKLNNIAWSPDGKVLAAAAFIGSEARERVVQIDAVSGAIQPVGSKKWDTVGSVAWLADGSGLIVTAFEQSAGSSTQVWHLSFPQGEARQVTHDLNEYLQISLTADSRALVAVQGQQQSTIQVAAASDLSRVTPVTSGGGRADGVDGLACAPDGRIVYTSVAGGNLDPWIMDRDGRNVRQLTVDPAPDVLPRVSRDGRHVVFGTIRAGASQIWRMDIDGGNSRALTKGPQDGFPIMVDGGRAVAFSSWTNQNPNHWKVPIDGGEPVPLFGPRGEPRTGSGEWFLPAFNARGASLDGTLLAGRYFDEAGRRWRAVLVPLDPRRPPRMIDAPIRMGAFTADGRAFTYVADRAGVSNIWSSPLAGGSPRQLTNFTSDLIFQYTWSPDGRALVMARGTRASDVVLITSVDK